MNDAQVPIERDDKESAGYEQFLHFTDADGFEKMDAGPDGFSEWVCPEPSKYLMKCCDCGLVHEAQFRVAKYQPRPSGEYEVVQDEDTQAQFRMRRHSPALSAHAPSGAEKLSHAKRAIEPATSEKLSHAETPADAVRQPLPPAFNIAELIEAERRSYDECGEADRDNAIDCLARLERRIEKAAEAVRQPLTDDEVTRLLPPLPDPSQGLGSHRWAYSSDDMRAYGQSCADKVKRAIAHLRSCRRMQVRQPLTDLWPLIEAYALAVEDKKGITRYINSVEDDDWTKGRIKLANANLEKARDAIARAIEAGITGAPPAEAVPAGASEAHKVATDGGYLWAYEDFCAGYDAALEAAITGAQE